MDWKAFVLSIGDGNVSYDFRLKITKTKKPLLKGKASQESIPMKIGTYYLATLK